MMLSRYLRASLNDRESKQRGAPSRFVTRLIEIQMSARSDLLVMDICHLRDALTDGVIDVGILVVPDDTLARFLTDRGPRFSDAVRHVRAARAEDFPLLLLGLHHDGPGEPLAKQKKKKMIVEE